MIETVAVVTTLRGIGTALKFADLAVQLAEVLSDYRVFIRLIRRVEADVRHARHCQMEARQLPQYDGWAGWIEGAIVDTLGALENIGKYIENVRVDDQLTGTVALHHRIQFVFNNYKKMVDREKLLTTCHATLLAAIADMKAMIALGDIQSGLETLEVPPPGYSIAAPRSPGPARRPSRQKPRALGAKRVDCILQVEEVALDSGRDDGCDFSGPPSTDTARMSSTSITTTPSETMSAEKTDISETIGVSRRPSRQKPCVEARDSPAECVTERMQPVEQDLCANDESRRDMERVASITSVSSVGSARPSRQKPGPSSPRFVSASDNAMLWDERCELL